MPAAQEKPSGLATTDLQPATENTFLPLGSDPDITLEVANLAENEQTWRLHAVEWKGFLSEPSYLDRELFLMDADITRDGAATVWILTSPSLTTNADGSRSVLASCETNRKNAYVATAGNLEKVISHGIGSVYCRVEHRGKGYAVRMMQELGEKLDTFQQLKSNKGRFSILYSDIGPKFYARHGWKAFPSTHITLNPINNAGEYHQRQASVSPSREIRDLKIDDLKRLESTITTALEEKLQALSLANPTKTYVACKPELIQFDWHFMREDFLAEILGREAPIVKGAMDDKTGVAIIWVRTYSAESSDWHLSILHVHVPNDVSDGAEGQAALSGLLLRAQWEAKAWDMAAGVELWDPSETVISAARAIAYGDDVQVTSRDQEHICSLKWSGSETDDIVWVANERFAWC